MAMEPTERMAEDAVKLVEMLTFGQKVAFTEAGLVIAQRLIR